MDSCSKQETLHFYQCQSFLTLSAPVSHASFSRFSFCVLTLSPTKQITLKNPTAIHTTNHNSMFKLIILESSKHECMYLKSIFKKTWTCFNFCFVTLKNRLHLHDYCLCCGSSCYVKFICVVRKYSLLELKHSGHSF